MCVPSWSTPAATLRLDVTVGGFIVHSSFAEHQRSTVSARPAQGVTKKVSVDSILHWGHRDQADRNAEHGLDDEACERALLRIVSLRHDPDEDEANAATEEACEETEAEAPADDLPTARAVRRRACCIRDALLLDDRQE